jgi:hypothetical protein
VRCTAFILLPVHRVMCFSLAVLFCRCRCACACDSSSLGICVCVVSVVVLLFVVYACSCLFMLVPVVPIVHAHSLAVLTLRAVYVLTRSALRSLLTRDCQDRRGS